MSDLSKRVVMPERDHNVRNKDFKEVASGYTEEMAIKEARRCLNCKTKPCVVGCPLNINIPEFIHLVAQGEFEKASYELKKQNVMPAVCGRVCDQEHQCEGVCLRGKKGESIAIGRLERFVADFVLNKGEIKPEINIAKKNKKVAVVGSGPSGLACAKSMYMYGYDVTIFEALHVAGGVLMYGIPEFRLPKDIVRAQIDEIKRLGIKIETNMVIGKVLSIDDLFEEGYSAVYIGTGAGLPKFMGIDGENANGVYSANEFLTRINLMEAKRFPEYDTPVCVGDSLAVIGGGNVAMDVARTAKRMGCKNVYVIYRRSMDDMPARREEVDHAYHEGVIFKFLKNPKKIIKDDLGKVCALECVDMDQGEVDDKGRRKVYEKVGSEHIIEVDTVVMAIGQSPNNLISNETPDIATTKYGGIVVDQETYMTTKEGVFAGGDVVSGAATVTLAIKAGQDAANKMNEYIIKKG
ncbi:MAG: NADPH-dependent glutamate synthase [Clostridiales bacterium]|nr:NADPH-dependent glutamate synthase [Clostridiales bacterium]